MVTQSPIPDNFHRWNECILGLWCQGVTINLCPTLFLLSWYMDKFFLDVKKVYMDKFFLVVKKVYMDKISLGVKKVGQFWFWIKSIGIQPLGDLTYGMLNSPPFPLYIRDTNPNSWSVNAELGDVARCNIFLWYLGNVQFSIFLFIGKAVHWGHSGCKLRASPPISTPKP